MKAYVFPGQGSQIRGMGGALFDAYPDVTAEADAILGYSIKELCLEDPRRELSSTQFTQPALFVVNALSYRRKLEEAPDEPDFLAGHSLGEFSALFAGGSFDFATGLQLVNKRAALMSQASGGAMAAILGASKEKIEAILQENGLADIDLANYNTLSQIVISGAADQIAKVQQYCTGSMMFYPLNTSGAFHSRLMRDAQAEFKVFLRDFTFADPKIPVIANVTARPYKANSVALTLAKQIASMVRWRESVHYLLQRANGTGIEIEEVGHGDTLTKMIRAIRKEANDTAKSVPAEPPKPAVMAVPPQNPDMLKPVSKMDADEKVRAWNARYPVGTRVRSTMQGYGELLTRSEAIVLFSHRAAVYMKNYNGYFDLDEVTAEPM